MKISQNNNIKLKLISQILLIKLINNYKFL